MTGYPPIWWACMWILACGAFVSINTQPDGADMCLMESTELLPSCCEFHGFGQAGCDHGRNCPAQRPVNLTQNQIEGMDDMLEFAEKNDER